MTWCPVNDARSILDPTTSLWWTHTPTASSGWKTMSMAAPRRRQMPRSSVTHLFPGIFIPRLVAVRGQGQQALTYAARLRQASFSDHIGLCKALKGQEAVISAAPFHHNPAIAKVCKSVGAHYLDLTGSQSPPTLIAHAIFSVLNFLLLARQSARH